MLGQGDGASTTCSPCIPVGSWAPGAWCFFSGSGAPHSPSGLLIFHLCPLEDAPQEDRSNQGSAWSPTLCVQKSQCASLVGDKPPLCFR